MTEPTHRSSSDPFATERLNSISDALSDATMADVGLQEVASHGKAMAPLSDGDADRGMPQLNRTRPPASGASAWVMLLVIVVVLAGAFWTVRHLLSMHRPQAGERRDGVAAQQIAGRVFRDESLPSGSNSSAPTVKKAPKGPVPVFQAVVPTRPSPAATPVHSYYDAPLLVSDEDGISRLGSASPVAPVSGARAGVLPLGSVSASQDGPLAPILRSTSTPVAKAALLGNRNFLLAKGTMIGCVLVTALDSTEPGITSCTVTRDVYSDNGHVVLIERGSQVMGEYQANVRQGQKRIFVLWDRVKTPNGVIVSLDSPAADALGRTGFDGYVDNHWWQRLGTAFMLSIVQDAIGYAASRNGSANGSITFDNTEETGNTEASQILNATINIPPTLSKNQGDQVSIYVARDLDFSDVYALRLGAS